MSGIVGVFNRSGEQVRRETIISMCDAINHRGPHDRGIWTDGPVGLGHVLLHTTEESLREEQPFSLDGKVWITADVRIDDREGLIDLLRGHVHSGENLQEATDVCLLLHSYHVWGEECVRHLTGVFAAVIWDGREQKLVSLRDHIGIKPFYHAHSSKHFIFASEVKGVLGSGLIPQCIYEHRIADFLVSQLEGIDKTCTFFEGIVRLPPAHRIVTTTRDMRLEEYWTLDPTRKIHFKDQRDYVEAFREQIYKAVHCRLRGSVPVASMLSGGVDSSSIVAVARDILANTGRPNLHTYSVVNSSNQGCLETFYINNVLAQGGLKSNNFEVEDTQKYSYDINNIPNTTDNLFDIGMHLPQIMYIEAKKNGITAMFDGVDGDLVMGQPGNHIAYLLQRCKLLAAIREARNSRRFYQRFPQKTHSYLLKASRSAFTPNFLRHMRQRWRELRYKQNLKQHMKETIINRDFAARIDLSERIAKLQSSREGSSKINLRLNHANALNHPYLVAALERYDRMASRYSIEPRHPILDRRLIEFCLTLPWDQKINNGWTKLITRRCMVGLLPDDVIWRKGFEHLGPQISTHLFSQEMISTTKIVMDEIDTISHYVDAEAVKDAYALYFNPGKEPFEEHGWKIMEARALFYWNNRWKK